jgi:hypothetical protein
VLEGDDKSALHNEALELPSPERDRPEHSGFLEIF